MSYLFDTNFLVSILFVDVHTERAYAWLERGFAPLHLSDWAATETFAVIQRRVRAGILEAHVAAAALVEFDAFARETTRVPLSARAGALAAILARDPALKLSAADALHLAIGSDGEHRLVTFDLRLAAAASARGCAVETP